MNRTTVRVLPVFVAGALLMMLPWQQGLAQSAARQKSAPAKQKGDPTRKATPAAAAPSRPEWLSINVVRVRPDMLTEWQEFQKNEVIPTLQKGGVKQRHVWQTAVFGESYEYVFVTPIESLARYDDPSPVVKALGEEGARAYGAKARRLIASSHAYAVQARGDLSYEGKMTGPPKLAVVTSVLVASGKTQEFESYIKNDLLPVMKKAGVAGYFVSQTRFGGDANEWVTVTLYDSFADIDKGPPPVRVLGQEGANRLIMKTAGIVTKVERIIARYNSELSFAPPAKAENK